MYNLLEGGPRKALEDHCVNVEATSNGERNSDFRLIVCGGDGSIGWALSVMDTMNIPVGKIFMYQLHSRFASFLLECYN